MRKPTLFALALAGTLLLVLALGVAYRILQGVLDPAAPLAPPPSAAAPGTHPSLQYGGVTTVDGEIYEGRLRWGGDEETFWGDYFNGYKDENGWAAYLSPEQLPRERQAVRILGFELASRETLLDLTRPFMARFGDIVCIEVLERDIRVTLKSGSVFELDRMAADDIADGIRVWDGSRGVVDLHETRIRMVEFFPVDASGEGPERLYGTVRTRQGEFTGFVQWNRRESLVTDELAARTGDGVVNRRFDTVRSISRRSADSALLTLREGGEIVLTQLRNRGIFVHDPRYGRVLVSWDAFESVEFRPGGNSRTYEDFPPGQPLVGSVTTRDGRSLAGRLVYDLDESETTETLDAPYEGVSYTILFGLIASVRPGDPHATVTLHSGEALQLEAAGDLGELHGGMLIFADGSESPEYVPWTEVVQVDFNRTEGIGDP